MSEPDTAIVDKPAAKVPRVLPDEGGLVLRLGRGERVVIEAPDGTLIVLTGARTHGVPRVHISAPRQWKVDRELLWKRKEYERCGLLAEFLDRHGDVNGNR